MASPEHVTTRVELCGGFAVEIEGRRLETALRGRPARLLFAFLVMHRGKPVRRDELVAALWPDSPPASPDDALNTVISRLRKVLGDGVIVGRSELTLVLAADASVDTETALSAIEHAERAVERSDWHEAGEAANVALAVAEHGFLVEIEAPWIDEERRRFEEVRLRALECVAACGLGLGGSRLSGTERAARALIAAAPYRETGYRYLMQALSERGRVAEALTVFDGVRRLLQDELGAPPGAGLRALHERLLRADGNASQTSDEDPLAVGSATTTVLCTDLVTDGDAERVDVLRRAHARLLRAAVAAHGGAGGRPVADGAIVLFTSARRALSCAVHLQRAADTHNQRFADRQLAVRVGLHCGEPAHPDDEHGGTTGMVARRLSALAQPGQIVASSAVNSLGGETRLVRELDCMDLPGVDDVRGCVEVVWSPVADQAFALPPALVARDQGLLVGRDADLDRLGRLYEQARSGTRQIVLLRGEPGIGKTRLATELARRAHAAGAVFLYGHCDEEPLLPHQPFVEALRHYVAACPLHELIGQVGPGTRELRRLVPELAGRLPGIAQPLAGDPEGERYRLFDAACALLCAAAESRPVVLVLDDLHWADKPTLLLLRHLALHTSDAPLLVLGTYRDAGLDSDHALSQTLAELSRAHSFERHPLSALDETAVARLVRSQAGPDAAPELARSIFERTEGNPFFVVEMLRHLAERGEAERPASEASSLALADVGIPEGVKAVIGRRIAHLGQRPRGVVSVASVCGRDFELAVLAHVSDLDEDQLVDALEQTVRARVIDERAGSPGRYTFSHALIREAIYEDLSGTRRALLHRRVAVALEETYAADLDPRRAELAHHFAHAGSADDVEKAIQYGVLAGERAVTQLAYEQAAAHYGRAVSLITSIEPDRSEQRCDLVIAQGEAERRAGDPAYRDTLLRASALARELGDAERAARAALANNRGFFSATAGVDRERVAVLEAALAAQDPGDTALRANLLAQLAAELVADPDWPRRAKLSDDALAMARRVGDLTTLARTLNNRYTALWGPETLAERVANAAEACEIADRLEEPSLGFHAANFGAHAAMEAGDMHLADRRLDRADQLAQQLRQPINQWYVAVGRCKRRSISGPLNEAEALAYEAFDLGRGAGQLDAFAWFINQLFVIRYLQADLEGGRPNFLQAAESGTPVDPAGEPTGSRSIPLLVAAVQIVTLCEVGRIDAARPRFEALMRDGLAELPHDWAALGMAAMSSVACAHFGDVARAERLYEMLVPHASQCVDLGPSWLGATTHYLGLLATVLGRFEESDAHFATTIAAYDRFGAGAWLARARLDWARCLIAADRGAQDDAENAEQLCRLTLSETQDLGLAGVARKAAVLLQELEDDGRSSRRP